MEVKDGKEDLLRELIIGLSPMVTNVEALKGQLYITLAGYDVQQATRELAVCDGDLTEMLIKKFLIAKTVKGLTERTIKHYGAELRRHLQNINKNVADITTDDLRMYLAVRAARYHNSKTQIGNIYRVFSTFFGWLYTEEYIKHNPVTKLDVKMSKVHKEAFSALDVERIRAATETNRDRAVIEMLLSTGCRVTELVSIKLSELKGDKIIVHGKGQKDRAVYLNARAKVALDAYLAERKDSNPWLFAKMIPVADIGDGKRSELKWWYRKPELVDKEQHLGTRAVEALTRRIGKSVGISPCNPHRFRHTCATLALRRGMDLTTVSKMLGHESVGTTQVYIDIDQQQLAMQHDKFVI